MSLHDFLGIIIRGTTAHFGNYVVALNGFCRLLGYRTYLSNKIQESLSALKPSITQAHGSLFTEGLVFLEINGETINSP